MIFIMFVVLCELEIIIKYFECWFVCLIINVIVEENLLCDKWFLLYCMINWL